MDEIWKDIYYEDKGKIYDYRGYYQVSNYGRIKSLERYDNMNRLVKEKILKLNKSKRGKYENAKSDLLVYLSVDGVKRKLIVSRIVAFMFIENDDPINKTQVNHIDEDPENNNIDNLEWCTNEYNQNFGTKNKRHSDIMKGKKKEKILYGKELNYSLEIVAVDLKTNNSYIFFGSGEAKREIQKMFNKIVDESTIIKICKYNHNKEEYIKTHKIINKTNKGFTFYYKEDFKECEE